MASRCRVSGLGFRVFGVWGVSGFGVHGGFRVYGLGWGLGCGG